jgi:hypothetical protein
LRENCFEYEFTRDKSPNLETGVATLETFRPYIEQLFEDSEVQEHVSRSAANLRSARRRAASANTKKRALKDPRLHRRLGASVRSAVKAGGSLSKASEKQLCRERRRQRLQYMLLALVGAVAYLAVDGRARGRLLDAIGAADTHTGPVDRLHEQP